MGHVEPEQDYYYDSEDFNDEDDYAPTSKKSKVSSRHNFTNSLIYNSRIHIFFLLRMVMGIGRQPKVQRNPFGVAALAKAEEGRRAALTVSFLTNF